MTDRSIWLIGCGNMAGAMLRRWLATGLDPIQVTIVRPSGTAVEGVRVLTSLPDEPPPAILMLGVKPQMLAALSPQLQAATRGTLLISILAGTETATLANHFPTARTILRAMPNLPVAIGKGVVALYGNLDQADKSFVEALMRPLGLVEWITDEADFDAVTALAGSGPAFTYRFIDALTAGATALGLDRDQAARLALAMVDGAASLAAGSDASPTALAEAVASKGGSTRRGLDVLDQGGALASLVRQTLAAATLRNSEIALETRALR